MPVGKLDAVIFVAAAVANVLHHATGLRICDLRVRIGEVPPALKEPARSVTGPTHPDHDAPRCHGHRQASTGGDPPHRKSE